MQKYLLIHAKHLLSSEVISQDITVLSETTFHNLYEWSYSEYTIPNDIFVITLDNGALMIRTSNSDSFRSHNKCRAISKISRRSYSQDIVGDNHSKGIPRTTTLSLDIECDVGKQTKIE